MRADSLIGKLVLAISRRTPAYNHDYRAAIATELRSFADAYDQWHQDQAARIERGDPAATGLVRAYVVRDQLRERADELDPNGGRR